MNCLHKNIIDNSLENIRFKTCLELSERRYLESLKNTKPICTWKNKYRDKLALCLHGNQQNIEICKKSWSFLNSYDYQVEYIQSSELDSYQLFRWEDNGDGPQQLKESIDIIDWNSYESKLLAGFSAGCNVILRAINDYDIKCDKIILQSPWIPIVNNKLNEILKEIKQKKIELLIICGKEDDDCLTQSKALATKALEFGIKVEAIWVEGLAHDFPENFNEIVGNYLK